MTKIAKAESKIFGLVTRPSGGQRTYAFSLSLICLIAFYAGLAICLSSLRAFWSPDSGARFAMVRSWLEHGSLVHCYYQSAGVDPTGQIHPLAYFLFHQPHDYYAMYEPLFPLLCGVMYRAFGFDGLLLIPVFSGLGTALLTYALGRRLEMRSYPGLPLVIGLSTPLLIYSVVFWDPVVMMFLAALASFWLLRGFQESRIRYSVWAGATLGLGIFIHELMGAFFCAVLIASLPLLRYRFGRRLMGGLVAGFIPLVLLWAATNWLIYRTAVGPHMGANLGLNPSDHPFSLSVVLDQQQLAQRLFAELVGFTSSGTTLTQSHSNLFPLFFLLACFLMWYWVMTSWFGANWPVAPLLSLAAASLALYLVLQVQWADGLFLATPLLIPALAIPWDVSRTSVRKVSEGDAYRKASPTVLFFAWMSRVVWLYIAAIFIYPMFPGGDWGSRYLLPALPLMVLLALHALENQYRASGRHWRHVVAGCAAALIGMSIFCQAEGLIMIRRSILYNREVGARARAVTSPVLVFDNIATGSEVVAASLPQAQFMVRSDDDWVLFVAAMRHLRAHEFTYIGPDMQVQNLSRIISSGNSPFVRSEVRFFHVDRRQQYGNDLVFARFVLSPHNR